ncbi:MULTISPECIES: hypothetical protein [unclassified Rhizobium]|uniref:hypothetical protein n=1 Tax=unclassified Rhizobium TaxID=2613769 RepID=UPI00380BB805
MATAAQLNADAMREYVKMLDEVIRKIRELHRVGKEAPKASARYLDYLRRAHEFREEAKAQGFGGALYDIVEPRPFHTGLVGLMTEQVREREWKGVFNHFPPAAPAYPYSIAAE